MRQIFVSFYKSTLYIKVRQHTALMLCDSRRNKTNHASSVKASEEEIQLSLKALNVDKPSEIPTFRKCFAIGGISSKVELCRVELDFLLDC